MSPAGTIFNVPIVGPMIKATSYRKAEAFFITSPGTQLAFQCKMGMTFQSIFGGWHVSWNHNKFKSSNYLANSEPYDVSAGSTFPSHILFGNGLIMAHSDLNVASYGSCNYKIINPNQHGLSPLTSGLDLHDPNNTNWPRLPDLSLNPTSIGLFFEHARNNVLTAPTGNTYGFPHLAFPVTHYAVTPFDAVWANNLENSFYDKNTMHVEDPNPQTSDFLVEEIAPKVLYLSNRKVGDATPYAKYFADFEARNSVLVGDQTIYDHNTSFPYNRIRTEPGNFEILSNAVVTIRANNADGVSSVVLGPGFNTHLGCIFRAYVHGDTYCPEFSFSPSRMAPQPSVPSALKKESRPLKVKRVNSVATTASEKSNKLRNYQVQVFPNPSQGNIYYYVPEDSTFEYIISDISGRPLKSGIIRNETNEIDLQGLQKGVYLITLYNTHYSQTDRVILY